MLNFYITDYSLYFVTVNCRQTKEAARHTQFLGFGKNIYIYGYHDNLFENGGSRKPLFNFAKGQGVMTF